MRETSGSEPPREYSAGEVIDSKFQLIRRVGAGGMGTVWVALNQILDVQVGIKLITFRGSRNRQALARRLLDEARSAARLGHPAVIKVHDFGVTDRGDPFIAMELLEGEDLACLLERLERVPADSAVQLMLPIAHGLAAAHDKGIVHRDIKPENIFLARDDDGEVRPKILDFGIARIVDSPTRLTVEGIPLGTPEYMSPEIARGELAESTSDIWSFSVVLYELVTGEAPFRAPNYNALMQAILNEPPTPLPETVDVELGRIILRGLLKAPDERWGSMRDMGTALARWLLDRGIGEDVSGTSLRRGWPQAADAPNGEEPTLPRVAVAREKRRRPASSARVESPAESIRGSSSSAQRPESADTDEYQLAAIAEMNRGGDPVEVLTRAEQRRIWALVAGVVLICLALVASILVGTGIIE